MYVNPVRVCVCLCSSASCIESPEEMGGKSEMAYACLCHQYLLPLCILFCWSFFSCLLLLGFYSSPPFYIYTLSMFTYRLWPSYKTEKRIHGWSGPKTIWYNDIFIYIIYLRCWAKEKELVTSLKQYFICLLYCLSFRYNVLLLYRCVYAARIGRRFIFFLLVFILFPFPSERNAFTYVFLHITRHDRGCCCCFYTIHFTQFFLNLTVMFSFIQSGILWNGPAMISVFIIYSRLKNAVRFINHTSWPILRINSSINTNKQARSYPTMKWEYHVYAYEGNTTTSENKKNGNISIRSKRKVPKHIHHFVARIWMSEWECGIHVMFASTTLFAIFVLVVLSIVDYNTPNSQMIEKCL